MDQAQTFKPGKWRNDRSIFLVLTAMTVAALAAALWATSSLNPLRGDSAEYLYFDRSRSVGYPAFLELIRLLTGGVNLAVPIQIALLAASLLTLGLTFHRFARRPVWSVIFMAALIGQAGMWFASAFLMTEALSTALVALWCAQLLRMTKSPSLRRAVVMLTLATMATIVRPPLIALFGGTAVFLILALPKRDQGRATPIVGLGVILACAATPAAQYLVHGSTATTSPFVRGVLQHTLYCAVGESPQDPDAALVEQAAAPVRRYIHGAPPAVREQLRRGYSTPLRFGLIIPLLGQRHQVDRRSAVDPYLAPIARQRVHANPLCYAGSVLDEYARMAIFNTDPTLEQGRRVRAFIHDHPPPEIRQFPVLAGDERIARRAGAEVGSPPAGLNPRQFRLNVVAKVPLIALLPFRLAFGLAALVGAVAILAWPLRRRIVRGTMPELPAMAAMGIAFHGVLIVTAIVEIGFFRYLVPPWPIVCTMLALTLLTFTNRRQPEHDD